MEVDEYVFYYGFIFFGIDFWFDIFDEIGIIVVIIVDV